MLARAVALALSLAGPAAAQDQISPDVFLDQAIGKTLTFRSFSTNKLVGVEQFLRRDLSVWTATNGRCTYGKIEIRGPLICFIYEDYPDPENCWTTYVAEGDLMVLSVGGDVQRITQIETRDISCEGAPLS